MSYRSLSFRLSVVVGLVLAVGLAAGLVVSMRHHEGALLSVKREEASLLAETIEASLNHAMLQGQAGRDAIHRAIEEVSLREEIERVRIYNAEGRIQYSSQPGETGTAVDKEAEGCRQCHAPEADLHPVAGGERTRFFYTPGGAGDATHRVLGVVKPIYNAGEKNCTACHRDQTVLGVLDVIVSLRTLDEEIARHRGFLWLFGSLGVGFMVLVVALLIRRLVHRPVSELVEGARKVGSLDLEYRIPADRPDEIGNLARAFNDMTARLQQAQRDVRAFAEDLERKVEEKTEELRATQVQMLRTEKMAAIGQMAAGVAHEINNPLTGVITFAHLLKRKIDPQSQEGRDLETIISEARRCSKIARGLLDFSRTANLDPRPILVSEILDRVVDLVQNQALFHNIEIVRNYDPAAPAVLADEGRIEQVMLNLVMNAAEAMDGRGLLTLTTSVTADEGGKAKRVVVEVADNGPGIPPEHRSRIFDPFFTTKEAGQGTGLGLAVSYRIVEDHGGRITVRTHPDEGTRFRVHLPVGAEGQA